MPVIHLKTPINAPRLLVFDLVRDLDTHCQTTRWTHEKIVSMPKSGLLQLGDVVSFEAVHFGVRQKLTSKVIECEIPTSLVDVMQQGAFKSLRHSHCFEEKGVITNMIDTLEFESPFGVLGSIVDRLVLERYMTNFLVRRNQNLKEIAEAAAKESMYKRTVTED